MTPALAFGVVIESALAATGVVLLWRHALGPAARAAERAPRLAPWPGRASDLFVLLLLAIGGALVFSIAAQALLRAAGAGVETAQIWLMTASQCGLLAGGGAYFAFVARRLRPAAPAFGAAGSAGLATFLMVLPIVVAVTWAWQGLLERCGLPVRSQDAVEIFERTGSLFLRGVFAVAAMVIAPMAEEILFRAGIFRVLRDRAPRGVAIWGSALLFGAAHLYPSWRDGLAAFVPLVVLGSLLAVAYERTGRIGTTMVAHALFNLNTLLAILLGLTP